VFGDSWLFAVFATIHSTSLASVYDPQREREICDEPLVVAHAPRGRGSAQSWRSRGLSCSRMTTSA
jgi:hypothetical protein